MRSRAASFGAWLSALSCAVVAGCAAPSKPPPAPASGLSELIQRPAERALFDGMRAYDDGSYAQAESALRNALGQGLASARDQATAHKLLAFVTCTSNRVAECESEFRAARGADPTFALSRSEAGHPVWGPVYKGALP